MENFSNTDWMNLPTHKPDKDLWERIDTELDIQAVSEKFEQLPQYSPKINMWNSINLKLAFNQYLKYLYLIGAIFSTIVIILIFNNIENSKQVQNKISPKANFINLLADNKDKHLLDSDKKNTLKSAELSANERDEKLFFNKNKIVNLNKVQTDLNENSFDKKIVRHESNLKTEQVYLPKSELNIENKRLNTDIYNNLNINKIATETTISNTSESKSHLSANSEIDTTISRADETKDANSEKQGIDPRKLSLKSTDIIKTKSYFSAGIDFTYNQIFNQSAFSNSEVSDFHQYGISLKYVFSDLFLQTGLNYSRFSDYQKYNSDQQLNQYKTYQYVDSVIYNTQGIIIQYITHQVTINDSIIYQQMLDVKTKISYINIPLMLGYQWHVKRFSFSLKTGLQFSFIIFENENVIMADKPDVRLLKLYKTSKIYNRANYSGLLSAEIAYNFAKRWGVFAEPILQYYFKPVYNEAEIDKSMSTPFLSGIKAGIYYKF